MRKEVFRWSKPRSEIRLSPYPPPCFVAYTPGVLFKISGNSMFPTFNATSCAVILLTAIGVCLAFAMSITPEVTTTSSRSTSRIVFVAASETASV